MNSFIWARASFMKEQRFFFFLFSHSTGSKIEKSYYLINAMINKEFEFDFSINTEFSLMWREAR